MKLRLSFLAAACAAGTLLLGASAVQAAPGGNGPNAVEVTGTCSGDELDSVINARANGVAAAHSADGTFVVTGFGEVTQVFTAPDGSTDTTFIPPGTKGRGQNTRDDIISCAFEFTIDFGEGGSVEISGTVFGFSPGAPD